MTPRRICAAVELAGARRNKEFALSAKAALIGAQGDPKKTERQLDGMLKR